MIKEIINYPDYYVDDSGNIYSRKYGYLRKLKQYPKTHGYLYVVKTVKRIIYESID